MGTSIGPVFTYLLTGTNVVTGNTLPAALAAVDAQAQVFDAWVTDRSCASQFVLGRPDPSQGTEAAGGTDALIVLGAGRVDEVYEIPCFIQTFVGGTDQSEARNAAIVIWDALLHWLCADKTLGGALASGWAEISRVQWDGTPEENAKDGRFCVVSFSIRCRNNYIP